jgi:AraC-like DNA-binding protein
MLGYATLALTYGCAMMRMLSIAWTVHLYLFYLLSLLFSVVLFYHFLWLITRSESTERFTWMHYIIPVVLTLVVGVWVTHQMSFQERFRITATVDVLTPETPLIEVVYMLFPLLFTVYIIIYTVFSVMRAMRYRKMVVDYSSNEERTSMHWLYYYIVLIAIWSGAPFVLLSYFWAVSQHLYLLMIFLPLCEIILVYNAIRGNYVLVEETVPLPKGLKLSKQREKPIDRKRFERYMQEKKPYLNPDLCITDIVPDLYTNRTYLSTFINKEYGMNFRTLINNYRLQELERIRQLPEYKRFSNMDLIMEVGFGSYRSYLNAERHYHTMMQLPFGT